MTIKHEKKRIDKKWRAGKKLGFLLGDSEDIRQLSYVAMNKIAPMWKGSWYRKKNKSYNALGDTRIDLLSK